MSTVFPLGAEQRSMLYLDHLLGPGVAINILVVLPVTGVARDQLAEAVARLGVLHDGLHTQIADEEQRSQLINRQDIEIKDAPDGDRRRALEGRGQDRTSAPRFCAELDADGRLLLAFDHLVCDGAARHTLAGDVRALLDGRPTAPQGITLERYCVEQAEHARPEVEYNRWNRILEHTAPLVGLRRRTRVEPWQAVTWLTRWAGPAPYRAVTTLHASPFTVVATALAVCLWRRTGIPASAVVSPISNRHDPDVANLVTTLVNERPIAYRIDPAETLGSLLTSVGGNSLRAVRNARLAWPDVMDNVPPFRALFHTPGAEYLQLQVRLTDTPPRNAMEDLEVLHPYRPAVDLTCTIIRVYISQDVMTVRAFYGGPVGGEGWVREILDDLAGLLTAVPGPDVRVRDLTWTARQPARWRAADDSRTHDSDPVRPGHGAR
jgi:hypothetical protein